jgi:hypothetical protein
MVAASPELKEIADTAAHAKTNEKITSPEPREQKMAAPRVDEARKSGKQDAPYVPTRKDVDAPFPRLCPRRVVDDESAPRA